MKTLVIYYSLEGNTRLIAQAIAQVTGADILELKPETEPPSKGFMKYFWGGRQVMTKEQPQLLPLGKDPQAYDLIFVGTPVWAFSYAPALATFFSQVKIAGKKIGLFCCSGGGKGKTLEKMAQRLEGNEIAGQIHFVEPLRRGQSQAVEKAAQWARQVSGLQPLGRNPRL